MAKTPCTLTTGVQIDGIDYEVKLSYEVTWGAPMYWGSTMADSRPAEPDEINDHKVLLIDGREPWDRTLTSRIEDALLDARFEELIQHATETDEIERDRADEMRAEDKAARDYDDLMGESDL